MDPTERAETLAALTGDEAAFEALIRLHGRRLFSVAYGVLQSAAEAEDVVQETFLKAWQTCRRPVDPEKFLPWLITVARHRACDGLRRRRGAPLEADFPDESLAPPGLTLDEAERATRIHRALATLPEHYRVALTLRYLDGLDGLDGLDCRAVEAAMGLTNGALRGILGRALETLRHTLPTAVRPTP